MADYIGTIGNDTIEGSSGNDIFYEGGEIGYDIIMGYDGDDLLVADYSNIALSLHLHSVDGTFATFLDSGGSAVTQIDYYAIERLQIIGTGNADDISTPAFTNSTINAGAGDDYIYANGGDIIYAGDGNDYISIEVVGGNGGNYSDNNVIDAGTGDDRINYYHVYNNINVINIIDGGAGIDTLEDADFSAATTNLIFDNTNAKISLPSGTSISNVEKFQGLIAGSGNDVINFKGSFDDSVNTSGGNDTINAGLGIDVVDGGTGNDLLIVNYAGALSGSIADGFFASGTNSVTFSNIERFQIAGSSGNDVFTGGTGNDSLMGNAGNDTLNGGNGNDTLNGGIGNDNLNGGAGVDNLIGGAGDDILLGGAGKDNLNGGTGVDKFKFTAVTDSGLTATTRDTIADFKTAQADKIDLSAIDANTKTLGNQAFSFIGTAAFSANAVGQLRFDAVNHLVYGSNDADIAPEFSILLTGVTSLTATDFIL
jgi:Ca2+-binding RTX toxin-like protein